MSQDIFDIGLRATGPVRTLVNQNSISYLKNFKYPRRLEMKSGDLPIMINDATCYIHTPLDCEYTSPETGNWTLVAVYHQGIGFEKEEIFHAICDIVEDVFFMPIAYTRDKMIDYFVVRNQNEALREMLKKKLQIQVNGWRLPMIAKLEVSTCVDGQIRRKKKVGMYLSRKMKESPLAGTLDLSDLSKEVEFVDMMISLRNKGVARMFFDEFNSIRGLKSRSGFRVLKLCKNDIVTLGCFKTLYDCKNFEVLDLSSNNIMDINELSNLKNLNIKELNILNNPCSNYPNLESKITKYLPKLQQLNSKVLLNSHVSMQMTSSEISGNMEISNLVDGILIRANNCHSFRNRFDRIVNDKYWSQVTLIHNKRYTLQEIMKELSSNLLRDVYFFPCYLKRLDNRDEFFLYRNTDALRNLLKTGMKIQMPQNSFTIDVLIRLNVAEYKSSEVNWVRKIYNALEKRAKEDVLDLNDFPKDPEFAKLTVLMGSNMNLDYILTQSKTISSQIMRINAENCGISICKGLENCIFTFPKLNVLNLRYNSIKSLEEFKKCTTIYELYLDGNPVCNMPPFDYIKHVRDHFKSLKWLDGHKVHDSSSIVIYQNYLIDSSLHMVVSEFVNYYFHMWDSFERLRLCRQMYDDSSIFTVSIYYDYNEKNSTLKFSQIYPRVQNFVNINRNLTKIVNMSLMTENFYVGRNIDKVFADIHRTKHDFSFMSVDVPYYDEHSQRIKIIVAGVFEEFSAETDENPLALGFSRTFLIELDDGKYKILNDQLLLREPTVAQLEMLNKKNQIVTKGEIEEQCRALMPTEEESQILKQEIMQKLTECSKKFCKKLLQDNTWDLKIALESFISSVENDEIRDEHFKTN